MSEEAQEKSSLEEVTLHSAGAIPGIPGSHGPGRYLVNWLERTISPIVEAVEKEIAKESQPESKEEAPAEPAPTSETEI